MDSADKEFFLGLLLRREKKTKETIRGYEIQWLPTFRKHGFRRILPEDGKCRSVYSVAISS